MTYALVGICLNDAVISVFKTKIRLQPRQARDLYQEGIRGHYLAFFHSYTGHPEYSSAHAVISASASEALVPIREYWPFIGSYL